MANYNRIDGVKVSYWTNDPDSDDPHDPVWENKNARLEEMYVDSSGHLTVNVTTQKGSFFIDIPVKASKDWNEFADSLPEWD
jgi:hypothetical protein